MVVTVIHTKSITTESWSLLPKDMLVDMLRNQIKFYAPVNTRNHVICGVIIWCNQNCDGLFYYPADEIIYFELESDMVAFKLVWDGKDDKE